jgi:nitronate monooxygenase
MIKKELAAAGKIRVGVGFITWALHKNPEPLDVALVAEPPAVMISFGEPRPYARVIKDAGAKLICQVQTLAQAVEAAAVGADIIVAQGRRCRRAFGHDAGIYGFRSGRGERRRVHTLRTRRAYPSRSWRLVTLVCSVSSPPEA